MALGEVKGGTGWANGCHYTGELRQNFLSIHSCNNKGNARAQKMSKLVMQTFQTRRELKRNFIFLSIYKIRNQIQLSIIHTFVTFLPTTLKCNYLSTL